MCCSPPNSHGPEIEFACECIKAEEVGPQGEGGRLSESLTVPTDCHEFGNIGYPPTTDTTPFSDTEGFFFKLKTIACCWLSLGRVRWRRFQKGHRVKDLWEEPGPDMVPGSNMGAVQDQGAAGRCALDPRKAAK